MASDRERYRLPVYRGAEWIDIALPMDVEAWPKFGSRRLLEVSGDDYDISREEVKEYAAGKPWIWPDRDIYFLCDIHADTDAFFRSLVASGGVAKTGPGDGDFELTPEGREATFVIGGDCLDKGPCNLRLLRIIRKLITAGADIEILAGNHDVRALVGFAYAGRKEPHLAHLFVRMGMKSITLFKEVHDAYLEEGGSSANLPGDEEVRHLLFPDESWFHEFPSAVSYLVPEAKIRKEVRRIREKIVEFTARCKEVGLTLGMVYEAFRRTKEIFLKPGGEFHWFFERMTLARKAGSFLFIHGGVDDQVAGLLRRRGIEGLNARFKELMEENLFELYHGPIGNTFRTKYRPEDYPFTTQGVRDAHYAGMYAIVHGHKSIRRGQRVVLRNGMLNIECDASVDVNTRRSFGLEGPGGAVTIFRSDGTIVAISSDYPYAKILDAAAVLETTAIL